MKAYLFTICAILVVLAAGCVQPSPPGSDRDSRGCIPSAGYTWCEAMQACIRPWEINCSTGTGMASIGTAAGNATGNATAMPGSDRDSHGCIPSAGYTWCEAKQKCYRAWEENCTEAAASNLSVESQARSFCGGDNVAAIYVCGDYVRVVSSLMGGGSSFYKAGQKEAQCPLVAPDSESDQCKLLLHGMNCVEQEINCSTALGSDRDSHGCIGSAGYSWCEAKQKCLRSWEENCSMTAATETCASYSGESLTFEEAKKIADSGFCASAGPVAANGTCNNNTGTWWIGITPYTPKPNCNPACVVDVKTKAVQVNWRCGGLIG